MSHEQNMHHHLISFANAQHYITLLYAFAQCANKHADD